MVVQGSQRNGLKEEVEKKLQSLFGRTLNTASQGQVFQAAASVIRDRIMMQWAKSKEQVVENNGRELYYLSMEFLTGRFLDNNLMNLQLEESFAWVMDELGMNLDTLQELEKDAGLGNGGLGRLAACFLDSLATKGFAGHGNGIRYEYGLFQQKIKDGFQVEIPDDWLAHGNLWEVAKAEEYEIVSFGGRLEKNWQDGRLQVEQKDCEKVRAVPYDIPVVGFNSPIINTLRLWGARAEQPMDMNLFGQGQYVNAVAEKEKAEVLSKVLYPEDRHIEGKSLRLKQQYFFVSASIQSILHKFKKANDTIEKLPEKVVIHINDTHPALAIPELMRLLMDEEGLSWEKAWDLTKKTFAYTNHTILDEALERWPVDLMKKLLPRIYDLIHEINEVFCQELWQQFPQQWEKIGNMAIISHGEVHMAHLAIVGSYSVNGVARLHTDIITKEVFRDFHEYYPDKFKAITNGVTHRRFLRKANSRLAALISSEIGHDWIVHPETLQEFRQHAHNEEVQRELQEIREHNKKDLARFVKETQGITLNPHSIYDVHIKRIHEYKRQLLNALHILHLYNDLRHTKNGDFHPRTFIFAGKAAPGYHNAKMIIKFIHTLAQKINNDPVTRDLLQIVFLENYGVSLAEKIIPATDVSEQISTAGKEASGTGNMKFMLNGALTVGTLDGANIEIRDQVGDDNIYIFGLTDEEIQRYRKEGHYSPYTLYETDQDLKRVLDQMVNGFLPGEHEELFQGLHDELIYSDPYFLLMDFQPYVQIHKKINEEYKNPGLWWSKAIINIAGAGTFSSDRTIQEYNEKIWKLPCHIDTQKGW